ncbi:FecCD family ABC transporter permease [Nocardioides sp.]|uniref:FecCD family ABC transporter permease n=1 Tax=Nocardioides sp. TaxID=35761 RepID=UPI0039E54BD3
MSQLLQRSVAEPADSRERPRRTAWLLVWLVVLLGCVVLSLTVGAQLVAPGVVWDALAHHRGEAELIVWQLRVPRTVAGVALGAALGLAGALMQSLTRNPLADPGLLGVNAGAACAVAAGVAFAHVTQPGQYVWFALLGAGVATAVVYLLGSTGRGAASPVRLVLAGAAVTSVLTGIISAIVLTHGIAFNGYRAWTVGSLENVSSTVVWQVAPVLVVGFALTLGLGSALNAIALGDQLASALGAHVTRVRVVGLVATTLLCGGATALAGPVAFTGLVVPHAVRAFTGPDNRWVLPMSALVGAVLVLASDVVGRVVLWPSELQVSVVTAVLGAPVFIGIVRRRRLAQL